MSSHIHLGRNYSFLNDEIIPIVQISNNSYLSLQGRLSTCYRWTFNTSKKSKNTQLKIDETKIVRGSTPQTLITLEVFVKLKSIVAYIDRQTEVLVSQSRGYIQC